MKTALLFLVTLSAAAADAAAPVAGPIAKVQVTSARIATATQQLTEDVKAAVFSVKVPADFDDAWGDGPKLDWFRTAQNSLRSVQRDDALVRDLANALLNTASYPEGFWQRAASGAFKVRPKPKN